MKTTHLLAFAVLAIATPSMAQQGNPAARLAAIKAEVSALRTEIAELNASWSQHLQSQGSHCSQEERSLGEAYTAMGEAVEKLAKESAGGTTEQRVFRAFHMVEYTIQDAQALTGQAGYGKALRGTFEHICGHAETLAQQGYRNPRVKLAPAGQSGLFSKGGGLFRRDDEAEKDLRHNHGPSRGPVAQTTPSRSAPQVYQPRQDPTAIPQRPIPRATQGGAPTQGQPQGGGGGLGDLLRTILSGGR